MWTAIIDRVLRRPVVSAVAATALLLVPPAIPPLDMKTTFSRRPTCRRTCPVMQTFNRIEAAFPCEDNQSRVVIKGENVKSGR